MLLKCFSTSKHSHVRNLFFPLHFYADDGIWTNYSFSNTVCTITPNELLLINIGIGGSQIMKHNFILKKQQQIK